MSQIRNRRLTITFFTETVSIRPTCLPITSTSSSVLHTSSLRFAADGMSFIVQPNELTPGIPSKEYEQRRKALMDSLPDDSIVVAVAAPIKYMSNSESKVY